MRCLLTSPRLAIQKGDFLGSGVPYWPLELATFAAFLRERGHEVFVLDSFGTAPKELEDRGDYYLQGASVPSQWSKVPWVPDVCFTYAISYMSHREVLNVLEFLRQKVPVSKNVVLENSQAVTAYAIDSSRDELFTAGATALLCGEAYWNWPQLEAYLSSTDALPPGNLMVPESSTPAKREFKKDGAFPIPAWDLFPIENYWALPYSHGPKTKRFLPILTSRGCPYPCDFCVVPETNSRRWRGRSAEEVVDEIAALQKKFGVDDFQLEDLNPTVGHERMTRICELLIERRLHIRFYLVSGTKAETVKLEQIPLYAKAGCRYLSISPESGSAELMKTIGKPFDYEHALRLVELCRRHGIATQACFVVGHPNETEADHQLSLRYLRSILRAGLDEAAIFIIAPFPGSRLSRGSRIAMTEENNLISFTPKGRANMETLVRRRQELIRAFFAGKLKQGVSLWAQGLRSLFGTPRTKMENLPKRVAFIYWLVARHKLRGWALSKTESLLPGKRRWKHRAA